MHILKGTGLLLACVAIAVAAAPEPRRTQDHVLEEAHYPQRNVLPDPDIPIPTPEAPPATATTTFPTAPSSPPPLPAVSTLDDTAVIALASEHPEHFTCDRIGNAWSLAEALGRKEGPKREERKYLELLRGCPTPALQLANLRKMRPLMASGEFLDVLSAARENYPALRNLEATAVMERETRREMAAAAFAEGDAAKTVILLGRVSDAISSDHDIEAAALLASAQAALGDMAAALRWEEELAAWDRLRPMPLAIARLTNGDEAGALEIAEAHGASDSAAAELAFGLRMERAAIAEDCRSGLDEIELAARWAPLREEDRRLQGWLQLRCGEEAKAYDTFAHLYRETRSDPDAEGLVLAAWPTRRIGVARALATELAGPLAARLPDEALPKAEGEIRYERLALDGNGRISVIHRQGWYAQGDVDFQSRRGRGPGRLNAWRAPRLRSGLVRDQHLFRLRIDRYSLSADAARPSDWPLDLGATYAPVMNRSADGFEGWLDYRRDRYFSGGRWDLEASLGFTPTGQAIPPALLFRLAAGQGNSAAGWKLRLERDAIRESLTSWVGSSGRLEVDGQDFELPFEWGRVVGNSIALDGYLGLRDGWDASASVAATHFTGENVPGNTSLSAYGKLLRPVRVESRFDLRAGGWVYTATFTDNLGRFSPGHGGYFSPAWMGQGGVTLRADSRSEDRWLFRGQIDLGWQAHSENAAALIPDAGLAAQFIAATGLASPELGKFSSTRSSGFAGGIEFEWGRPLGKTGWYTGGRARWRLAPQYDETEFMLLLRYNFDHDPGDAFWR